MKPQIIRNNLLALLTISALTACGGGGGGGSSTSSDTSTDSTVSADPEKAVTESITFSTGVTKSGTPPQTQNNPDDPIIGDPPSTQGVLRGGGTGTMKIDFSNVPANTPFDVNIRFGSNSTQYTSIPIGTDITGGVTSGSLSIPFSLQQQVCSNLDDIQHQIQCYESVSVGGTQISKEQARQLILDCQQFNTDYSFCAYNYPKDACDIIISSYTSYDGYQASYYPGTGSSACDAYGNVDQTYDFGGYSSSYEWGEIGACVLGYNY